MTLILRGLALLKFLVLGTGIGARASAQTLPPEVSWAIAAQHEYQVSPNITYLTADNHEVKLDVYHYRQGGKRPTVINIHGGGWLPGFTKDMYPGAFWPFLALNWNVVNIDYRHSGVALAPAAVEDCLCALRWVIRNAAEYNIDTDQIVVFGQSAGGHLALMTGMVPESAGLTTRCPGTEPLKVAAIIDMFGITDVGDLLTGENRQSYAVAWLGAQPDIAEVARRSSPLTYVRPGLPPILIMHGDKDTGVPYTHSVRLRDALTKAKARVQLHTVAGGGHGDWDAAQFDAAYRAMFRFLAAHGITVQPLPAGKQRPS
ncbi:MAG TPA: alpha/beta hydrolase [Burkholderiaceae bacterium]|nr:alpha/beta hydrolase [Burkholderiaceae bacterium]